MLSVFRHPRALCRICFPGVKQRGHVSIASEGSDPETLGLVPPSLTRQRGRYLSPLSELAEGYPFHAVLQQERILLEMMANKVYLHD